MLPLGMRVQENITKIIREELDAIGCQYMSAPLLHPLDLWAESGRSEGQSFGLLKVRDRNSREFVLSGTGEEMFVDVMRQFDISYRDLPVCLYQLSTKFRDEARARFGLWRCREFLMKDGYSFHTDEDEFSSFYEEMCGAYTRIYNRLGLSTVIVEGDTGFMGGYQSHEFVVEHPLGESYFFTVKGVAGALHVDRAPFVREQIGFDEPVREMRRVEALRGPSIEEGVRIHGVSAFRHIKSIVVKTDAGEIVLAALRGDLELNEEKLARALGVTGVEAANEEDLSKLGLVAGFISPLVKGLRKVGDLSLPLIRNAVTGGDCPNEDRVDVNYGRDYEVNLLADIASAQEGFISPNGGVYQMHRGVEVGNTFILGTHYSERMKGASYTASDGTKKPYYMGCYGIGVGRTLQTIAELYHDERGLLWGKDVAPFQIHFISMLNDAVSDEALRSLHGKGLSVLEDDRDESMGVKFAGGELYGIPLRLVHSKRSMSSGGVEWHNRLTRESGIWAIDEVAERAHMTLS